MKHSVLKSIATTEGLDLVGVVPFPPVTSHQPLLLLFSTSLLHYFVASSFHSRSSSLAESSRRNSQQSSAPYPPECPVPPGSRPRRLPANSAKSAPTPSDGLSSPSADRDRIHCPR